MSIGGKYMPHDMEEKTTAGIKYDQGKARYDLIPAGPLELLAQVYSMGAAKYEDRGWEKGLKWGRVFAAIMRHLWAFWRGESFDKESGLPHPVHAAWGCMTLLEFMTTHKELDDRPSKESFGQKLESAEKAHKEYEEVARDLQRIVDSQKYQAASAQAPKQPTESTADWIKRVGKEIPPDEGAEKAVDGQRFIFNAGRWVPWYLVRGAQVRPVKDIEWPSYDAAKHGIEGRVMVNPGLQTQIPQPVQKLLS